MRFFTSALILLIAANSVAQQFCRTTEAQARWFAQHPELKPAFEKHLQDAAAQDKIDFKNGYKSSLAKSSAAGNYTIPVVFHILHLGGNENISDAQVIDQIAILNRDFNKLNADTVNIVQPFKNLVGNTKFEFRLAAKDPNGDCTNGIIRHWDPNTNWTGDFGDYIYSWPNTRYLNIYVVRSMGFGAAAYTYLPGSGVPNAVDAIVITSGYVGSIGSGSAFTSRVLTHEIGHWFDLEHTWGSTNSPGVACGDDGVSDTPLTMGFSGCALGNAAICNPPIVENVQNYMEYAYCDLMFTMGQSQRMQNAINSPVSGRNNLSTPANLALTGVTTQGSNCVPLLDIVALPSLTVCSGKTLTLKSFTSNVNPNSYLWTAGNGATVLSPGNQTTSITFNNVGTTTINCTASGPGGSVSKSLTVFVVNGATDYGTTYSQSFEASALPQYWNVVNNFSPGQQWQLYNTTGSLGVHSMYVPGELMPANTYQILEGPSFDFKNNPGAVYTFKYAYALPNMANKDIIKVQASKDCGGTWSDIWVPSNINLANTSGGITSQPFVPNQQWVLYNLTAHPAFFPFTNEANVKIRYYFEEDHNGVGYGNRFYLDEINFSTPTGINELSRSVEFNVYPNPANAEFKLSFNLSDASGIKYTVTSLTGSVLESDDLKNYPAGKHTITLNKNATLVPGIYFVNLELNGFTLSRKVLVN